MYPASFGYTTQRLTLRHLKELVDAAGGAASDLIKEDPETRFQAV